MHVVVTGGAGFIGGNLCRRLVDAPGVREVTVVDDLSTGSRQNLAELPVRFVEGSILSPELLDAVLTGADAVVHLAARPSVARSLQDPRATHTVNVTGTVEVLEAARRARVPHLVLASSSSVYGATAHLPKSEDLPTRPMSPYAASKLAAESYALAHAHAFGVRVLALRFFNVFGPLQAAGSAYAAVVPTFLDAALRGAALQVNGDGRQTRDFTYVDSVSSVVTEAVLSAVRHDGPVNLAAGSRVSILGLIQCLEQLLGKPLDRHHVAPRVGDVRDSQADTAVLRSLFPHLQPVPLMEGLTATLEWFRGPHTTI